MTFYTTIKTFCDRENSYNCVCQRSVILCGNMNATTKRNLKSKAKTATKTVTLKDIILRKDQKDKNSATTNVNDSQNESFIDVFKLNAAKEQKLQSQSSQRKKSESKSDDAFDELFSEFKSRTESSKSDSASKSDDSFDELFSDFPAKPGNSTKETKPLISQEEKDFAEILRDNLSPRCPICFRKNNYESEAIYISHLKKCAYNNKMTMEQLKKALELQHKQTSERAALGLPIAPKERPQRKYQNKGPMDSNLELGLALSNSLREFDYMNIIQEKEALVQAGIEPETLSQYKNLEDFGFASNKPAETTNYRGSKRNKNPPSRSTVLFTRTQEERDRIITEKVANLLIDGDSQTSPTEFISEPFVLKSKYLKKHIDAETTLWKKSSQMEDNSDNLYYVTALSNFITPCTIQAGSKLRHLSQIPCRPPSPDKPTTLKNVTVCVPSSPKKLSIVKPVTKKPQKTVPIMNTVDSQLRLDWKYLLNKNILSDLTIYVKNEVSIFAHKLVFYARCRSILTETIEEVENNKRSEMLMWMEYSFEAAMALLEYIYTGGLPDLNKLNDSNKKDLRALSDRYSFKDVIDALDHSEDAQMFSNDEDESFPSKDCKVPSTKPNVLPRKLDSPIQNHSSEIDLFPDDDSSPKNIAVEVTEGEKNLQMMLDAMKTQPPRSPELFEDDSYSEEVTNEASKSQNQSNWEEVLSRLCSPVRSPSPKKEEAERDVLIPLEIDLTQEFETDKKTVEKRKSFSPLEKGELKKTKTLCEEKSPKSPLSQVITLSDTSVSDSDESLYKLKKVTSDNSKSDFNLSVSSIDKVPSKDPGSSNSQSTHISGIDEICPVEPEPSVAGNTSYVLNEQPCEEIDPIWDGFEDFNSMPCDYDYFPESAPIPVNNSLRELSSPSKPETSLRKSITDSLFGSFTVEEGILNKIEAQAVATVSSKPSSSSTPDSVRKFQRRSRSENSITPINKCAWNNVTPMADYSGMKNEELKKELEKYGIKPGLSRNKAKMMLKYIYEELHPFEDKISVPPPKIDPPTSHQDSEKNPIPSANSCDSSDSDTSGVSLLEETYMEDEPEICTQDSGNPKSKVDLLTGFTNLLRDDKLLQRKILLYEPIWLEPLKTSLKEYGVRCSLSELMNYLDEKCVTFRTQQQRGKRKKKKSEEKEPRKQKAKRTIEVLDL